MTGGENTEAKKDFLRAGQGGDTAAGKPRKDGRRGYGNGREGR